MPAQRDVRNRIDAVKNIQKITRAMEMVAAARLRRAEQRIEALRPYADAIRRMTRQAAEAAGDVPAAADPRRAREVAAASACCWSPATAGWPARSTRKIVRAGVAAGREHEAEGHQAAVLRLGPPAGVVADVPRARAAGELHGFTDRPSYADARAIAERLMAAYIDGEVDQVEIFYNGYISPISQVVRRETLLPLQRATILDEERRRTRTRGEDARAERARSSSTSPIPRRSSSGWCRTTSRSRSTARCSSRPPPSTARG